MIPAIAILKAGVDGALSGLIQLVSTEGQPNNTMYFWLTGLRSSFLDNAPTYVFFLVLQGEFQPTLCAIFPRPLLPYRLARFLWVPTPKLAMRPTL